MTTDSLRPAFQIVDASDFNGEETRSASRSAEIFVKGRSRFQDPLLSQDDEQGDAWCGGREARNVTKKGGASCGLADAIRSIE